MSELSWKATVLFVHERANFCCEYCQTCQKIIGQAMHVEHIIPNAGDHPDNLALSCANCNFSKSKATVAPDPLTGEVMPLFNPRIQIWSEHFRWVNRGEQLEGLTPIGRATLERLKMNQARMIESRKLWVEAKLHPPR